MQERWAILANIVGASQSTMSILDPETIGPFSEEQRAAVYQAISLRRDIRHFRPELDVDPEVLERVLAAAHLAPSVGFSQPWGFVIVRDRAARERIRGSFLVCREAEAARYPDDRRALYLAHKLEGILEAPVNVCVAVDLRDRDEAILGTTVQPEAVRASACCAVQNLWLAARAEGLGVGWVSIIEPAVLRTELALPRGVEPIAYLCIGHPVAFRQQPMLEETGWRKRRSLNEIVHATGKWEEPTRHLQHEPPKSPSTRAVESIDAGTRREAQAHQNQLTKPRGSLGRLEELSVWYAGVCGAFPPPAIDSAVLAVFAADHGVAVEGVSAYGSQVTSAMVANVMAGGAAVNALAEEARVQIMLTDVGIAGDLSGAPTIPRVKLRPEKVRAGTANLRYDAAMTRAEAEAAIAVGERVARDSMARGARVIGLGEIGIGNTTSASALVSVFTGEKPADVVGRGTGINDETLARKIAVVEDALARHRPNRDDPVGALAAVGGLEIGALIGCALEAARHRIPVVLDGFVTSAAALVAAAMDPRVREYLLSSHASTEPGAARALRALGLFPLLDLRMRLGEGTGAALAITLLRAAVHTQLSMATFATAGIVGRQGIETR